MPKSPELFGKAPPSAKKRRHDAQQQRHLKANPDQTPLVEPTKLPEIKPEKNRTPITPSAEEGDGDLLWFQK